ncbi:MAG: copper homeostasis protein CutC [Rikenellaceae bacterium]
MVNQHVIEICANSVQSCIEAEKGGASRVELCAAIPEGGTTPSYGEILMARKSIDINLNVIIRPRSGDFLYSPLEVEVMKHDIATCKALGVDGVVFGMLTSDGNVDSDLCRELLAQCGGMAVTFHRAFDVCRNPMIAIEEIIALGFSRILTSGQAATAYEGRSMISDLVKKADNRIIIMPGCGINEDNINIIKEETSASEFHLSARHRVSSQMQYHKDGVSMGGIVNVEEFAVNQTSADRVKHAISNLDIAIR